MFDKIHLICYSHYSKKMNDNWVYNIGFKLCWRCTECGAVHSSYCIHEISSAMRQHSLYSHGIELNSKQYGLTECGLDNFETWMETFNFVLSID